MSKCFQCHTDAMFRDQRQDRRGWEATIYRMIGRGGLYTADEIKLMADYLGTDFGPGAKPGAGEVISAFEDLNHARARRPLSQSFAVAPRLRARPHQGRADRHGRPIGAGLGHLGQLAQTAAPAAPAATAAPAAAASVPAAAASAAAPP